MVKTFVGRPSRAAAVALTLAVTSVSGCADQDSPVGPPAVARPGVQAPSFFTTADQSTASLSTLVSGPSKFTDATTGWYTYSANVTGGIGPYRYDWFEQRCYTDGYCSELLLSQSGIGLNSIQLDLQSDIRDLKVTLHVYDAQTDAHVGVGSRKTANFTVTAQPTSNFKCDLGESYFPVQGTRYDSFANSLGTQYYRRNGCTGQREWAPPDFPPLGG